MNQTPPNILMICSDAIRHDWMGCAGNNPIRTPHLDSLAGEGVRFARAYCSNPICTPARSTMFTGLLPRDHGVWNNNMEIHPRLRTLPGLLTGAGYATFGIGKIHMGRWIGGLDHPESVATWQHSDPGYRNRAREKFYGFERVNLVGGHGHWIYGEYLDWLRAQHPGAEKGLLPENALWKPDGGSEVWEMSLPEDLHYNNWIATKTLEALQQARDEGRPFFIWCSFPDPHPPLCSPAPYGRMYDPSTMPLPSRREGELDKMPPFYKDIVEGKKDCYGLKGRTLPDRSWQEMRAMSYGMTTHMDAQIGRILKGLKDAGLWENTVTGFVSDHGSDMLGDHWQSAWGSFAYEEALRIPLILRVPGGVTGRVHDGLTSQIDLMPTILDACGVPLPGTENLVGVNPTRFGQQAPLRLLPGRSLMPLLRGEPDSHPVPAVLVQNDEPYLGIKARTIVTPRYKLTYYAGETFGELFDLEKDPHEFENLWSENSLLPVREDLLRQLLELEVGQSGWQPVPIDCA